MKGVPFACDCPLNVFTFDELICPVSQRVQRIFIFVDNLRILYLSCTIKNLKQLPSCLKRSETTVVLFVFDGVLCEKILKIPKG